MMNEALRTPPTLQSLRKRRAEILALAERHGVSDVRVVGSVARGDAQPGSDVDLLVSVKPGVTMFDLVGLWQDLQALLGCEVNLLTDGIPDEPFMWRVRRDAVRL